METLRDILSLGKRASTDEDLLRRVFGLGSEYSFHHRDKWVIDSHHKLEREAARAKTKDQPAFFRSMIDWLVGHNAADGNYLFVSRSTRLGVVIEYRKDRAGKVKGSHPVVVTWLGDVTKPPLNKKSIDDVVATKSTDKKVVLEYYGSISAILVIID